MSDEYDERDEQSRRRGEHFKGSRREELNQRANYAAAKAELDDDQRQRFHRHIHDLHNDDLEPNELYLIALEIKSGSL